MTLKVLAHNLLAGLCSSVMLLVLPAILLVVLPLASPLQALNKTQFINQLKQTPAFKQIALQIDVAEKEKNINDSGENWSVNVSSSQLEKRNQEYLMSQSDARSEKSIGAGLTRNIFATGGDVSLSQQWTKKDFATNTGSNNYHDSTWQLAYSHPLLKNRDGIVSQLASQLSRYDIAIAKLTTQTKENDYLLEYLALFFDWLSFEESLAIETLQLNLLQRLLALVTERYQNDLVDETDVLSHQGLVLEKEQSIIARKRDVENIKTRIGKLFADESIDQQTIDFDLATLSGIQNLGSVSETITFKKLRLDMAKTKHEIKALENKQQADLDLTVSVASQGQDSDFHHSNSEGSAEYIVGLTYQYPLGNDAADNTLMKKQLDLKAQQLNYDQQLKLVSAQRDALANNLESIKAQLTLVDKRLLNAKRTSKRQQQRYDNAQIDISLVIDALKDEQAIELEKVQYQVSYHKARHDYYHLFNQLPE